MSMFGSVASELGPKSGQMPKMPKLPSGGSGLKPPSMRSGPQVGDSTLEPTASVGIARWINIGILLLIIAVITGAVTQQFGYGMPPSELGILARSALLGVALGPILNLLWGMRPQHYAASLIGAVVGSFVGGREIMFQLSNEAPTDPNEFVFGIPLYQWAVGVFLLTILGVAAMLLWTHSWMAIDYGLRHHFGPSRTFAFSTIIWLSFYLVLSVVQVLVQCGAWMCPANPVSSGERQFFFDFGVTATDGQTTLVSIPGFITVMLGIGVVSFIIGAILNRTVSSQRDREQGWTD